MKKMLHNIGAGGLIAYLVVLAFLPVLWSVYGETQWLLILLRYLPGFILLAPIPILVLMAWNKKAVAAGLVAGLLGVFYFMGLELPARSKDGPNLRVMSYNIRAGLGGPEAIAEYLADSGIEVIALQEARAPLADPKADPVPTISDGLDGYSLARGGSRGELVVLSRHPIIESQEIDLGGIARALDVRLDVTGEPLRVINLHLMTGDPLGKLKKGKSGRFRWLNVTAESRAVQFEALNQHVEEEIPTLILGDFNTPPNSDGHALLSQSLSDCFGAVGSGFGYTFRADLPVWRIDYVWSSRELVPCTAEVESCQLSDHRPLVVELDWKNRENLVPNRSPEPGDEDSGNESPQS